MFWTTDNWLACFKNLVKIGVTHNVTTIFINLSKFLLAQKSYDILNKILEGIIPSVFTYLQVDALRESALTILEFYLIGGVLNEQFFKKTILRLVKSFESFVDFKNNLQKNQMLVYHIVRILIHLCKVVLCLLDDI